MVDTLRYAKYPFYLLITLLVAKFGYIIIESFYNYHVLVTTTSAELSKESIEALNSNGHRISSVGITLLLIPLFYLLVKKLSEKSIYIILTVASIVTYTITYNLLNSVVDVIVKANKEHRHDAYYVNIFKFGILNNIFEYDSFIDSERIKKEEIDVNDRILLTNSFLLLHADKHLISKLKERGKEAVADIYIAKYKKDDYQKRYEAFKSATEEITLLWKEFNSARKVLYGELKKYEDEDLIKKSHKELIDTVKAKYTTYVSSWKAANERINSETSGRKTTAIKSDLQQYFRYQEYDRAQRKYQDRMREVFGYVVDPNRWLNDEGEVTSSRIKRVIREEVSRKVVKKFGGIPGGLNAKAFFNNLDVKVMVAKKLKEKGILIPVDFSYSYAEFKKYYVIAMTQEQNRAPKLFYKKLEEKIGKNDLKLNFDWNMFIDSNYIKNQITKKLGTNNTEDIKVVINAIRTKDLGNFKRMVYLPKVVKEVENMMYKEDDFLDGGKAASAGDDAIKLLYIPPFALSISIIALLLNMITLTGMLLSFSKMPKLGVTFIKFVLVVVVVYVPFMSKYDGLENPLIKSASTDDLHSYLSFLNWISYYEQINAKLHE